MIRKIIFAFAAYLCALPALSQVATGLYNFGAFDNLGFDTVDRGSLNVHFSIPILNKAGRGLPFQYTLVYDGLIWSPVSSGGSVLWSPDASFGLHGYLFNEGFKGYLSYDYTTKRCTQDGSNGLDPRYFGYVYHDQFGVNHSFTYTDDTCTGTTTGSTSANDGSGYTLNGTDIIARDGTTLTVPVYVNTAPTSTSGSVSDTNGNQISFDSSGNFTDTTGNKVLTISGSGTASSPKMFSYLTYGANPNNTTPPSASTIISYKTYTVQTAFGCSGVGEYNSSGTLTADLPDKITLADGSFYKFAYEPTPGKPANVTGRLASITLPTGGIISYSYPGANGGINCADGTPTGITRTTADGQRTYTRSIPGTGQGKTTISDGFSNQSVSLFVTSGTPTAFYETDRKVYQGSTASGTLILDRQTCYNGAGEPCFTTALTLPISQTDTYETLNGIQEHGSTAKYNTYGLQTDEYDYDFGGASSRGSLLRHEVWTYPTSGIANLLSADRIYDGSANLASQTTYSYDGSTPTSSSGVPQHVAVTGQRGNLTGTAQYSSASAAISTSATYEDTGSILTSVTPNGTTTYSYDPTFVYTTGLTPPTPSSGVSLASSATYDPNTGLIMSVTDPNGAQSKYSYTEMNSLLQVTNLDSGGNMVGKTYYNHESANQVGVYVYQNANSYGGIEPLLDGYGRPSRTALANGQGSSPYYQKDTCYDADGRVNFQSYPYQGGGWGTAKVCSGTGNTYSYDALGRITQIAHADGTTIKYSYNGRATQVSDENGVTRVSQIDGLGRLTSVCEISSSTLQGVSPTNCGLDIAGTGFATTYAYNLASQTTTVTQGVQTRVFQTDWLGRPILVKEPESGQTTYSYAYNSTGLLVTRKRPKANQTNPSVLTTTTSQYDALGRLLSTTYDDGVTSNKNLGYDTNCCWSQTAANLKGRLAGTGSGSTTNGTWTGSLYSYDAMGRVVGMWQCGPSTCGTSNQASHYLSFSYDSAGNLTNETDSASGSISYGRSLAGEMTSITNQTFQLNGQIGGNPATLVSNVQNGPNGPTSYQLGNGLDVVSTYDSIGKGHGWVGMRWLNAASLHWRYSTLWLYALVARK